MNLETISFNNTETTKIYYAHLQSNTQLNIQQTFITEYDIAEVINNFDYDVRYYPKRIYIRITDHMIRFMHNIHDILGLTKTKFVFSIRKHHIISPQIRPLSTDIVVDWDRYETTEIIAYNKILDIINNMHNSGFLHETEELDVTSPRLVIIGRSLYGESNFTPIQIKITNQEKTFKTEEGRIFSRFVDNDNRMHTIHKEPNVMFCSCGHICICSTCRTNLVNKNKCISCKLVSVNVREI